MNIQLKLFMACLYFSTVNALLVGGRANLNNKKSRRHFCLYDDEAGHGDMRKPLLLKKKIKKKGFR